MTPNLYYDLGYAAIRSCMRALAKREYSRSDYYWLLAIDHAKFVQEETEQTVQQIMTEWTLAVAEEMSDS
jgi:hypothetical protein